MWGRRFQEWLDEIEDEYESFAEAEADDEGWLSREDRHANN
jgi:hypothetical protein